MDEGYLELQCLSFLLVEALRTHPQRLSQVAFAATAAGGFDGCSEERRERTGRGGDVLHTPNVVGRDRCKGHLCGEWVRGG